MNQTKYKTLKRHFPGKKLARFVSTTHHSKLSFRERWVYSTLLWRYKRQPVSKARLSRWTGVDRTRTLPKVLVRLINLRLVVMTGQKYRAVPPPEDMMHWFATYVVGEGEQERLVPAYNWAVYDPDSNIIDGLVACADAVGHHAAAKLAKRFGVCGKTITAARRRLNAGVPEIPLVEPTALVAPKPEPPKEVAAPAIPAALAEQRRLDPAEQLAKQYADFHGMSRNAAGQITVLCRLLISGMPRRDIGQIVSALVQKYGVRDGLEDAVDHLLRRRYNEYFYGPTKMEKVLADIGVGRSNIPDDDDDPSLFDDESFLLEAV